MPISLDTIENVSVNIGPWMKFTKELFEFLKAENAAMANMTFSEAAIAMGYKFVSGVGWVKNISLTTEAVITGTTAAEAIAGTVATGAAETTTGTIVLTETASGGACAMGLGTIATGVAAVCLAGASGYIIGNVIGDYIDNKFPEFFDGLFCSVSKFLTGSERGLAFLFDGDGHSYLPESTQLAVRDYLAEAASTVNESALSVTIGNATLKFKELFPAEIIRFTPAYVSSSLSLMHKVVSIISTKPVYACFMRNSSGRYDHIIFSSEPFQIMYRKFIANYTSDFNSIDWQDNGLTSFASLKTGYSVDNVNYVYHSAQSLGLQDGPAKNLSTLPINDTMANVVVRQLIHEVLFGNKVETEPSKVPEMQKYEVAAKPQIKVHTQPQSDTDEETEPETWIRIPLPEPSPDPETLPKTTPTLEPTDEPETEKLPKPLPQPKPQGTTTPSPEIDPSTEPDVITPVPPTPTPTPEDTGSTPKPPIPVIPPISPASGLLHVYNPTAEQVNEFGAWLWTTFSGDIIDTISKLFNNPMDAVIGLHELYCTPIAGSSTTIKAGFLDSDVTSRLVTQRYTEINCGAITVPEYWGNYLDYAPYTKVYCYLPFIGIVELNTDDIIGHGVQVVYKIDTYNGSCIAMIITAKNKDQECVKYQFSGNCAVEVPITSGMKSAMQSALIGAATAAIGASAAGVISKGMLTAAGVNGAAQHGLNGKNSVSHSGSFGSSYGAMGIKKPYFIVRRPIQKVVENYNNKYGYPAHSMVNIGSCSGYLRCRDFDVQSSTATEEEKRRIEILLKEGVYV